MREGEVRRATVKRGKKEESESQVMRK